MRTKYRKRTYKKDSSSPTIKEPPVAIPTVLFLLNVVTIAKRSFPPLSGNLHSYYMQKRRVRTRPFLRRCPIKSGMTIALLFISTVALYRAQPKRLNHASLQAAWRGTRLTWLSASARKCGCPATAADPLRSGTGPSGSKHWCSSGTRCSHG